MKLKVCLTLLFLAIASDAHSAPVVVHRRNLQSNYHDFAVSNGGKWIAMTGDVKGGIQVFDGRHGRVWVRLPLADGVRSLRFTPDCTRLLTTGVSMKPDVLQKEVALVAVPSGRKLRSFAVGPDPIWCNNSRLLCLHGHSVMEFNLRTGRKIHSHVLQASPDLDILRPPFAFSSNGKFLVEGSAGVIRVWNTLNGRLIVRIKDHLRSIGKTAISDDGKWIASEGDDPHWRPPSFAASEAAYARTLNLHVWKAHTGGLVCTFPGYEYLEGGAFLLAFAPDGRTLLGCDRLGQVDRFDVHTRRKEMATPKYSDVDPQLVGPLAMSEDGLWFAGRSVTSRFNGWVGGIQLWSLKTSTLCTQFESEISTS